MTRTIRWLLLVLLLGRSGGAPLLAAEDQPAHDPEPARAVASRGLPPRVVSPAPGSISMDVVGANLEDVLKLLSQQAGLNFVAAEAVRDKRITVYMDQVPTETAIRSILDANGLTFHRMEDSEVFIVTESGGRPIRLVTRIYTLKFARVLPTVTEAVRTFGNTGSLIKPLFSGTNTTGTSGTSGATGTSQGTSGLSGGATSGALGTGTGEPETQGIVAIVRQLLTDRGSVTTDPRTNSLAVTDVPESFPAVEEALAKLDTKPAQVYIEAEVLEVTLDTLRRLGIEYGTSTGNLIAFTGPKKQTHFPLGKQALKRASAATHTLGTLDLSNVSALLRALVTEKDVKYLASPRLMTLSNEVAEIRIVTDAATGTTTTSQATTGTTTSEAERQTVGTVLRITPLVTEGKYITMVIEPEVSRLTASATFSDFLDPNRRAARTTVMAEDGRTVMIGGLLSQEWQDSRRKLPFLGDLPIIGLPFRRTEKTNVETEIIIFITPHLVPDGPAAGVWTVPPREQAPWSSKEQQAYRRYREELLRQQRRQDAVDLLLRP